MGCYIVRGCLVLCLALAVDNSSSRLKLGSGMKRWWSFAAGFEAETEDELTVSPGDAVTVQVEVEGWVQITRDKDGQKGLVPASYLEQS